ncbi:unnamed protein product [Urochloa humidicola]
MAGLKVSWACILIIMIIMSSSASSGEARRLLEETRTGGEACTGGCHPPVQRRACLTATATKMANIDGRPTAPGHSPGIGNKIVGNTR